MAMHGSTSRCCQHLAKRDHVHHLCSRYVLEGRTLEYLHCPRCGQVLGFRSCLVLRINTVAVFETLGIEKVMMT